MEQAKRELRAGQVSYIPEESVPLRGLAQVNQELVQEMGRRCAEQKIATIDLDATVIESWKREAQATYQGGKGYQPMLALWAEMDLVMADEFRDGNVPAHSDLLGVTQRAFQALPETVEQYLFRGTRPVGIAAWCSGCGMSSGSKGRKARLRSPLACG